MENIGTLEWLVISGSIAALFFIIARTLTPSRPDDGFSKREDRAPSRREQRAQNLKGKGMLKSAIKPAFTLTAFESIRIDDLIRDNQLIAAIKIVRGISNVNLKDAKDYITARKAELGG